MPFLCYEESNSSEEATERQERAMMMLKRRPLGDVGSDPAP